jgi:hypothetical protein
VADEQRVICPKVASADYLQPVGQMGMASTLSSGSTSLGAPIAQPPGFNEHYPPRCHLRAPASSSTFSRPSKSGIFPLWPRAVLQAIPGEIAILAVSHFAPFATSLFPTVNGEEQDVL